MKDKQTMLEEIKSFMEHFHANESFDNPNVTQLFIHAQYLTSRVELLEFLLDEQKGRSNEDQ